MHITDDLLNRYSSIVYFDVETTGLSFEYDDVIELACVLLQKPDIKNTYDWLVNIGRPLPNNITEITNITDKLLETEGVSRETVVDRLQKDVFNGERVLLIAHNANFDLNFLRAMFAKENKVIDWDKVDAIDTLTILKDRKPYPHKLSDAIREYNLDQCFQNTHRAIDDVEATLMVFEKMFEENTDVMKYINLFGYNPKYEIRQMDMMPEIHYLEQPYNNTLKLYQLREGV